MTSSGHVQHQQQQHQAKFRWTENLTCRFIQLRREHGNMFTGRKYSAQAGWEYILRQMRDEFPTIMADVHYRVLKKKWSNLLQQYKELKNPVHGDKNKADDISWPFYAAIGEVLGNPTSPRARYQASSPDAYDEADDDDDRDDNLNPQEFLCVSVAPDTDDEEEDAAAGENGPGDAEEMGSGRVPGLPGLQPLAPVFGVDRRSRKRNLAGADSSSEELLSRLPRATELTICPIPRRPSPAKTIVKSEPQQQQPPALEPINNGWADLEIFRDAKRPRMSNNEESSSQQQQRQESRLERKLTEFLEYTRKRDEENRAILMRMLEAIEDIRNAVR